VTEPTIHPRALPDDRPADALHIRPGADGTVRLDPSRAGWRYLSFETVVLAGGDQGADVAPADASETCLVVITGHDVVVEGGGERWQLEGRDGPFAGLPSALWLPDGRGLRVSSPAGAVTLAVARAPRSGRAGVATEPILIRPGHGHVEIRGAGNATRQINHIIAPDFPADRLEVVEVLTPSGNWSSWPPHKHDVDDMPAEAVLEEVYHYRFRRPEAWAIQRVYRADRSRDGIWEVRDGDVVIVPDGYHPFSAAHGDDAYYLNALAGDRRTMACSFDPDLDWVRETWSSMAPDPRLPLVPSVGSAAVS
jgi:5-deoxy-glucuronate isomerase